MSASGSITSQNSLSLHNGSCCRCSNSFLNPSRRFLVFSKCKMKSQFPGNQSLQSLGTNLGLQNGVKMKMNFIVYDGVEPPSPVPSDPSPGSWKFWILGILIPIILPFWTNNWGSLFKLKKEIETAVETADHLAEAVETVAEKVEEVAEEAANKLPEGGKLKDAITFVENVAKETAKDAHIAEEVIEKVEKLEEDVESLIEQSSTDEANDTKN